MDNERITFLENKIIDVQCYIEGWRIGANNGNLEGIAEILKDVFEKEK